MSAPGDYDCASSVALPALYPGQKSTSTSYHGDMTGEYSHHPAYDASRRDQPAKPTLSKPTPNANVRDITIDLENIKSHSQRKAVPPPSSSSGSNATKKPSIDNREQQKQLKDYEDKIRQMTVENQRLRAAASSRSTHNEPNNVVNDDDDNDKATMTAPRSARYYDNESTDSPSSTAADPDVEHYHEPKHRVKRKPTLPPEATPTRHKASLADDVHTAPQPVTQHDNADVERMKGMIRRQNVLIVDFKKKINNGELEITKLQNHIKTLERNHYTKTAGSGTAYVHNKGLENELDRLKSELAAIKSENEQLTETSKKNYDLAQERDDELRRVVEWHGSELNKSNRELYNALEQASFEYDEMVAQYDDRISRMEQQYERKIREARENAVRDAKMQLESHYNSLLDDEKRKVMLTKSACDNELQNVLEQLKARDRTISQLNMQVDEMEVKSKEYNAMQAKIMAATKQAEERSRTLNETQQRLGNLEAELIQSNAQYELECRRSSEQESELNRNKTELDRLSRIIISLEKENNKLNAIQISNEDLTVRNKKLTDELANVRKQSEWVHTQLAEAQGILSDKLSTDSSLRLKYDGLLKEHDSAVLRLEQYHATIREMEATIATMHKSHQATDEKKANLERDLEQFRRISVNSEQLNKDVQTLTARNKQLEQENEVLKSNSMQMQKDVRLFSSKTDEIVNSLSRERMELNRQLRETSDRLAMERKNVASLTTALAQTEAARSAALDELNTVRNGMDDLNHDRRSSHQELSEVQSRLKAMLENNETMMKENALLKVEITKLKDELYNQHAGQDSSTRRIKDLEQSMAKLERDKNDLERSMDQMSASMEDKMRNALDTQATSYRRQIERLRGMLHDRKPELDASDTSAKSSRTFHRGDDYPILS